MKRLFAFLMIIMSVIYCMTSVFAEENNSSVSSVSADMLNEGEYDINVKSSSSMFRVVKCTLYVKKGEMYALMTLSGKGYEKLFMGTGEEALNASDQNYIYFVEDSEGKYTYTVPVEALNADINCAAWSIRKKKWYDRVLVFETQSLPEEAFKSQNNNIFIIIITGGALIILIIIIISAITLSKKKKVKQYEN